MEKSLALRLLLARPVDLRVDNTHMPRQRIIPRESLLLSTEVTPDFLFGRVVFRILVAREIVRTREDNIARLVRCRVDAHATMGSSLRILGVEGSIRRRFCTGHGLSPVTISLVPLQFRLCFESSRAVAIRAAVCTTVRRGIRRSRDRLAWSRSGCLLSLGYW